jgi:hypothetical protein
VYEQRSPTGEQFGQQRIIEIIAKLDAVDRDISAIFDAVQRFACTDMLDDDATAASVEIIRAP